MDPVIRVCAVGYLKFGSPAFKNSSKVVHLRESYSSRILIRFWNKIGEEFDHNPLSAWVPAGVVEE